MKKLGENMIKQGENLSEKPTSILLMSFLTNRQVFKTPNWYLNQTFW